MWALRPVHPRHAESHQVRLDMRHTLCASASPSSTASRSTTGAVNAPITAATNQLLEVTNFVQTPDPERSEGSATWACASGGADPSVVPPSHENGVAT